MYVRTVYSNNICPCQKSLTHPYMQYKPKYNNLQYVMELPCIKYNKIIIIIKIYCHINLSFDTRSTGYGMKKGYLALIIGWKDRDRKILKCAASSYNVMLIISSPPYIRIK